MGTPKKKTERIDKPAKAVIPEPNIEEVNEPQPLVDDEKPKLVSRRTNIKRRENFGANRR